MVASPGAKPNPWSFTLSRLDPAIHPNLTSAIPGESNTVTILLRAYDAQLDLETCLVIWRGASERAHAFLGLDQIRSQEEIVREHYMPAAEITVAESQGQTAGFVALLDGFVGGLFVAPAFHRHGIGRKLILDAASRKGPLDVEVYRENSQALAFYEALEFEEVSERPLDDMGLPHALVRMHRASGLPD